MLWQSTNEQGNETFLELGALHAPYRRLGFSKSFNDDNFPSFSLTMSYLPLWKLMMES